MRMWMNSKFIEEGDIFLVDKSNKKYVLEAIKNGASKIVTEEDETYSVETIKVDSIKKYLYDNYKKKITDIKLIGITGTNGKTTTCFLIYQMLKELNVNVAYIGTIGLYYKDKIINLDNTTPSIDILYNILAFLYDNGINTVVMEVSSHALKQERVYNLLYDAIGVTNITLDHQDYHKTMEDYILSKSKLITSTRNNKICVLNRRDKYYRRFINKENNNIIIGKDIKIKNVKTGINDTNIVVKEEKKLKEFNINLVGNFNVYNFLMAYQIVKKLGYNTKLLNEKYIYLKEPKGRMEKIIYKDNVIFIDYAHTPDAVLNVLKTVKKIKNKGIVTVIGCGGNRDKTKRDIMAKIASKYSSYVIFTNDNPRDEDEKEIIKDMLVGASGKYDVIYDRYEAIKKAVSMLDNNKILMILGKGHEDYQIIKDKKYYFSDYESVRKIIED